MKREIKFRAWDGNKIIYEFVVAGPQFADCLSVMTDENFTKQTYDVTEWKLMQFTGLLDKNGKEIYEGDIIPVYFAGRSKNMKVGWYEKHHCFALFVGSIPHCSNNSNRSYLIDRKSEVIGNIYENPELLNK